MQQATAAYPTLFAPFSLGALTLRNRTVMPPMSTQLGEEDGRVSERQIAFYRARATGGTGMIIVEFCCVHRASGQSEPRQLGLETEEQMLSHRPLVETIRSAGAVACLQLQHGGPAAKRKYVVGGVPVGPCDVFSRKDPQQRVTRGMSEAEIQEVIESFGRAAERGVQAGYQAVELHGAHGYLLTCFLSPLFNQRSDGWGGSEERRLRLPLEVIARVKRAIGSRPLIYRLSADEFSPMGLGINDTGRISAKLVEAGVDAIHVSTGVGQTSFDKVIEPMSAPEGWRLPYSRHIRETAKVPVITVGQIRWPATAEQALVNGDADLIALGRPLLADPDWARKAEAGQEDDIIPCTSCNYCVALGMRDEGIGCAQNPRTGREMDPPPRPPSGSSRERRATVVGGGPGGMSAALLLDEMGFRTELLESRDRLGGSLIASAAPPLKDKLEWFLRYLLRRMAGSGISVRLSCPAEPGEMQRRRPDIVVLATGGQTRRLPIPGVDRPNVFDAYELLMGAEASIPAAGAGPMLVYGGGETGCETAEWLVERGHEVLLVSRSPAAQLARSAEMIYRGVLLQRIRSQPRIKVLADTRLESIGLDTASIADPAGTREISVAGVVIAQGRVADPTLETALRLAGIPVAVIGDARQGGRIGDAVRDAYRLAFSML